MEWKERSERGHWKAQKRTIKQFLLCNASRPLEVQLFGAFCPLALQAGKSNVELSADVLDAVRLLLFLLGSLIRLGIRVVSSASGGVTFWLVDSSTGESWTGTGEMRNSETA